MPKIIFKYGCMGSAKTANLLMTAYSFEKQDKKVVCFSPSKDTRSGLRTIKSRTGMEREAIVLKKDTIIKNYISKDINLILVDESQFVEVENIRDLINIALENNIIIIFYGLRLDYTGNLFKSTKEILKYCTSIEEIKMTCEECNNKATNHLLVINEVPVFDGDSIVVDDKDEVVYHSVCLECWLKYKNKSYN